MGNQYYLKQKFWLGNEYYLKWGSACIQIAPYILPALQLSDTRRIPNDLKDDLICPITREVFKDPVLASDGNTYEQLVITTWLKGN